MSIVLTFATPEETDIVSVKIYRATSEDGSYSLIDTVSAVSGSGAWVTSYEDTNGTLSSWYKIKFNDGTSDSDFSNAMKGLEKSLMCTIYDVKKHLDTTGRWDDIEVEEMIKRVEEDIYDEYGDPLSRAVITTDEDYTKYFVGEPNIFRVDRAYYGTTTRTELVATSDFTTDRPRGIVTLTTGDNISDIESLNNALYVDYVPRIFSRLCAALVAQRLLKATDVTSGMTSSKELSVIAREVENLKNQIMLRAGPTTSTRTKYYDSEYGINMHKVEQALEQNKWM